MLFYWQHSLKTSLDVYAYSPLLPCQPLRTSCNVRHHFGKYIVLSFGIFSENLVSVVVRLKLMYLKISALSVNMWLIQKMGVPSVRVTCTLESWRLWTLMFWILCSPILISLFCIFTNELRWDLVAGESALTISCYCTKYSFMLYLSLSENEILLQSFNTYYACRSCLYMIWLNIFCTDCYMMPLLVAWTSMARCR
jgi:hypothetical protein